ncbi:M23 family metallopeptidase [Candidatus Parcubacteria bacterium]|nr:M23 family metallopeptidase [Candidatus Parcubacteria bacterium]MBT3948499.1 M23 family metallopeptidase [Candidatus Parcubacteria bacterium]
MKRLIILIILGLAILGAVFFVRSTRGVQIQENDVAAGTGLDLSTPEYKITEHIVGEDDIFATIMEDFGFGYSEMLAMVDAVSSTYDLTRIRVGQPIRLAKDEYGHDVYLEYERSKDLCVRVYFEDGGYRAEEHDIKYDVEIVKQGATVSSSMYIDGLEANIPEEIIMEFADTFAWTIDFSIQVKKGDSFEILYEKRSRDGEDAGMGNILAGKFVNVGEELTAYLFENEEGDLAYYSGEGESMVRQFLRAPLNFRRISSGYTYARFDPINGAKTPHLAIDYAAAIGTPIMSVGDGVIRFAGWNNQGYGNFVKVRHNDVYTTEYAHMSGFAKGIRNGVSVKQGQIIGYVGSTGWSTGPHLHYQIRKHGSLVNPLALELPPGDPIPEGKQDAFEEIKKKYNEMF